MSASERHDCSSSLSCMFAEALNGLEEPYSSVQPDSSTNLSEEALNGGGGTAAEWPGRYSRRNGRPSLFGR